MRSLARLALVVSALAVPAFADEPIPRGEAPTVGVFVPAGAIAGGQDATAVELDPANLGFLQSWNAMFIHTELDPSGVRGGRGDALYFGTPIPFLSTLSAGAAVQSVRPPDNFPYRNETKLNLSLAWRPIPALAFGATYAHLFTGDTPGVSGIDTLDLAVSARITAWLALAMVVRDVPGPQFQGLSLQRVYEPEIAFRFLSDERIELGIGARFGERRGDVDPRFRLYLVPYPGLRIRGALELKRDIDDDGIFENDLRATVGLDIDFERIGLGAFALFGGAAGGSHYHGFSVEARLSGDRYPAIWSPSRMERIDLTGGNDRSITALLAHLRRAEHDSRVDGFILVLGDLDGAWATMEELREELGRLRKAGKHVYAYGAELTTKSYFVGTGAEKLWLDPAGGVRLVGMAQTAYYFKGSLDLLSVQADFVKIAEYKSAPEQYTRTGPSDEAKMVRDSLIDDVYGRVIGTLAEARKVSTARMRELVDRGPYTAEEARRVGLVDDMKHGDEIEDAIGALLKRNVEAVAVDHRVKRSRSWEPPEIAVIYVDGDIIDGKSITIPILDMKFVGHQTLLESIVSARADPKVKAIVLRIDSPGGSALASDLIAREIGRTRRVKPVICSFGDVAASGGYFVAALCDEIIASPSTITGSIGIFTGKFDVSGLATKLGVGVTVNKRGEHADIEGLFRPYTDEERAMILEKLRYFYNRFVDTVAEGRGMKHDDVDQVARGRVWTGAQARERKLVDKLGGFMDAVIDAKKKAGMQEWEPVELRALPEEPSTLLGQLAKLLGIPISVAESISLLPALAAPLKALPGSLLHAPSTPQARMEPLIEFAK
jgi:protease-4